MRVPCPTCKKPSNWENNEHRPFCSKECKDRDLGNWAAERYRVQAGEEPEGESGKEKSESGKDKKES